MAPKHQGACWGAGAPCRVELWHAACLPIWMPLPCLTAFFLLLLTSGRDQQEEAGAVQVGGLGGWGCSMVGAGRLLSWSMRRRGAIQLNSVSWRPLRAADVDHWSTVELCGHAAHTLPTTPLHQPLCYPTIAPAGSTAPESTPWPLTGWQK